MASSELHKVSTPACFLAGSERLRQEKFTSDAWQSRSESAERLATSFANALNKTRDELEVADRQIKTLEKRFKFNLFRPKFGVGAMLGVNRDGRADAMVGLGLFYEF